MNPQAEPRRILVAEDDPALADVLRFSLTRHGLAVDVARDGATALKLAQQNRYDAICSDYQMPGLNGGDLLAQVRQDSLSCGAICILCSAKSYELDCQELASRLQLHAVFYKPFSLAEICASLTQGLAQAAGRRNCPDDQEAQQPTCRS